LKHNKFDDSEEKSISKERDMRRKSMEIRKENIINTSDKKKMDLLKMMNLKGKQLTRQHILEDPQEVFFLQEKKIQEN